MEDLKISYKGKGRNKTATITFNNQLTVFNVEKVFITLTESVNTEMVDQVEVNNLSNLDLAGLQLLIALKNKLKQTNKQIGFSFHIDSNMQDVVTHCGFTDIFNN
jgi:ABC-type transporter Mla MlaB component